MGGGAKAAARFPLPMIGATPAGHDLRRIGWVDEYGPALTRRVLLAGFRQNPAHVFSRELRVFVDKIQTHRLTVHHRQRMAQFETRIALVSDVEQAEHLSQRFLVALHRDAAIGAAIVLAAVMPQDL